MTRGKKSAATFSSMVILVLLVAESCVVAKRRHGNGHSKEKSFFEEDIERLGYPHETHHVKTKDHFVLTLFRIQSKDTVAHKFPKGKPVILLAHGLDESADIWILNHGESALAVFLANQGFDVWMLNNRGTTYSRQHAKYSVHQAELWDFSFQEMAMHDVPVTLNYISRKTKIPKMIVIGHSQGSTQFVAAMTDPLTSVQVQSHMHALIGISPVAHISDVPEKTKRIYDIISYYVPFRKLINFNYPFLSTKTRTFFKKLLRGVCDNLSFFCEGILAVPGLSAKHNKAELIPKIMEVLPGGSSFRCYEHYNQLSKIGGEVPTLRKFDFGPAENIKRYGVATPPDYDYNLMSVPFIIHSGHEDILVTSQSLERLTNHLKTLGKKTSLRIHSGWDHFSVISSTDPRNVFDEVLADINLIRAIESATASKSE